MKAGKVVSVGKKRPEPGQTWPAHDADVKRGEHAAALDTHIIMFITHTSSSVFAIFLSHFTTFIRCLLKVDYSPAVIPLRGIAFSFVWSLLQFVS